MVSTKNYSKDSNTLGWQQKGAGPTSHMSSVALQAQGFQLPQQAKAVVQPYPVGLSHTQDPRFMNQSYGKNEHIRNEKEKRSHVGGQKAVEDSFQKPGSLNMQQDHIDQLYLKGGQGPPSRVALDKNASGLHGILGESKQYAN